MPTTKVSTGIGGLGSTVILWGSTGLPTQEGVIPFMTNLTSQARIGWAPAFRWDTTVSGLGVLTSAVTAALNVNGNAVIGGSTAHSVGFFGAAGSTKSPAYTTAAITSARVFPSTASISTFTGVSGSGASFTSRADLEALVRVVASMYDDLKAYGLLR